MNLIEIPETKRYLILADAHLRPGDSSAEKDFFSFLMEVEKLPLDTALIFLGDIFELWIAVGHYEDPLHRRFLDWCAREKNKRTIVFLEGNHEFFVTRERRNAFSIVSADDIVLNGIRFSHGDRINTRDTGYKLLRFGVRNRITFLLLKLFARWIGPAVADQVRLSLKNKNMAHKKSLPEADLKSYGMRFGTDGQWLFVGHFHEEFIREHGGRRLRIVPAWANAGEIVFFDPEQNDPAVAPWRKIIPFSTK